MSMPSHDEIKNMAKKTPEELLAGLSPEDRKKINAILSDKSKTESILQSPQAKMIMKMLGKGKGGK